MSPPLSLVRVGYLSPWSGQKYDPIKTSEFEFRTGSYFSRWYLDSKSGVYVSEFRVGCLNCKDRTGILETSVWMV